MTPLWPPAPTPLDYEAIRGQDGLFRAGASAVCETLGLDAGLLHRFEDGSLPVYAIGAARVLKLYPPFDRRAAETEAAALRAVEGRLPVPTPTVHAEGGLEGWSYLLMERLRGESLAAAWPRIPPEDRRRLAGVLGEMLATLHSLRGVEVDGVGLPGGPTGDQQGSSWPAFIEEQRRTIVERQRQRGLDEIWLTQIPVFLDATSAGDRPAESLLHTEIMREHLLVEECSGGWVLSGLFDFEPAMVGDPEYEFASVGLFFSCGDAALLRGTLLAYGYAEAQLNADLSRRLLRHALLHRYSNLPWYLRRLPPPAGTRTLDDLAGWWWGMKG